MEDKIKSIYLERNKEQAVRVLAYLRSVGFKGSDTDGVTVIIAALNALYQKEHSDEELTGVITDCTDDCGIDAVVFSEESVDIFDCKKESSIKERDIIKLKDTLNSFFKLGEKPNSFNGCDVLKKYSQKFHSLKNKRKHLNINIVRYGLEDQHQISDEKVKRQIDDIKHSLHADVRIFSGGELINKTINPDWPFVWELRKTRCEMILRKERYGGKQSFVLKVPILDLVKLHEGNGNEKKRIFDSNVRSPKKSFSFRRGLIKTLKNNPELFFLFHNGITVTAESLRDEHSVYLIRKPQVVNGAQTLENLYQIYKKNKEVKLEKSFILCKFLEADPNLTGDICEASNTQKAVKVADLRTNDAFQKELALFLDSASKGKYFYDRKGDSRHLVTKGKKIIPYTRFFQWAYAALSEKPGRAKNSKTILFDDSDRGEYKNIVKKIKEEINSVLFLCETGLFVESFIKGIVNDNEKGLAKDMNLHIVAGLFCKKTQEQDRPEMFKIVFNTLNSFLRNVQEVDINMDSGRLFSKSEEPWKHLKKELHIK